MCGRLEVEVCRDGEVANGCFFSCQQPDPAGQSNNESILAFISPVCPRRPPAFSLSPSPSPFLSLQHGQASRYMNGLSTGNSSNTGHLSTPCVVPSPTILWVQPQSFWIVLYQYCHRMCSLLLTTCLVKVLTSGLLEMIVSGGYTSQHFKVLNSIAQK